MVNDEIDSAVAAISSIIDAEGSSAPATMHSMRDSRTSIDGIQRAIDHHSTRK